MTVEERSLRKAVAADPTDEVARMALHDYWEESGQPLRAEFVRVQDEIAALRAEEGRARTETRQVRRSPRLEELLRREQTLEVCYGQSWRYVACDLCRGSGHVVRDPYPNESPPIRVRASCPVCDGTGDMGGLLSRRVEWRRGHAAGVTVPYDKLFDPIGGYARDAHRLTAFGRAAFTWHPIVSVMWQGSDVEPHRDGQYLYYWVEADGEVVGAVRPTAMVDPALFARLGGTPGTLAGLWVSRVYLTRSAAMHDLYRAVADRARAALADYNRLSPQTPHAP